MLVGVTPRPFWYVSWGEPVVVLHVYLFRRRGGPGPGPGWWHLFFSSLAALATNSNRGYRVIFFFVCKPVVVGGRGHGRKFEVGMISILG